MAYQKSVPLISPGLFRAPRITAQRKLPQVVLLPFFFSTHTNPPPGTITANIGARTHVEKAKAYELA